MSLEKFKKQVLILHSEQSTLDNLSSGFNDRYTVHCATSGSEALNTLGETQIDVIVSSQKLPGMTGLEALREAKKRSPDTIGILLAGNQDDGLEAIVGDQEVFQVVRGEITADALRNLIDGATQQARLIALAESANDTSADVDQPESEHIVMETADNGSAVFSDGTARLRAVSPDSIARAENAGARAINVVVLTQDEEFLSTVRDSARGLHHVTHATTLRLAEEAIRKQKTGVTVIDAASVGSNVEKVAQDLRSIAPRLVPVVAGRRDNGEMLMDLINRGKVYRFLLKPVSPGRARLAIEASVKHHLEAPDSAFSRAAAKPEPIAVPKPKPKAAPKPEPKAAPKPEPKAAPKPKPIAVPEPEAKREPEPEPTIVLEIETKPKPEPKPDPKPGIEPATQKAVRPGPEPAPKPARTAKTKQPAAAKMVAAEPLATKPVAGKKDVPNVGIIGGLGGWLLRDPRILAVGAAVIVAIIGISTWLLTGSDTSAPAEATRFGTPAITEAEPVFDMFGETVVAATDVETLIRTAETAILERRINDAASALAEVSEADPGHARLPFLSAQLDQIQLRDYLDNARLAIRETRFEDAGQAIEDARALEVADATEIDSVADELSTALSEQRVEGVLVQAGARLDEGKLITPSNDNARYYYELALSNDPENPAARQGLTAVAAKLVLQARSWIDAGELDKASELLAAAGNLDPNSRELAASNAALKTARGEQEKARAEAERRAAAKRAAAAKLAAENAAAEPATAERAAAERAAEKRQAAQREAAQQAEQENTPDEPATENEAPPQQAAAQPPEPAMAARSLPQAKPETTPETTPVSVSSLKRSRYVAPKYPRAAQRRGTTGWVDIVFAVDIDGSVTDIAVRGSEPGETFVQAATRAVENWEFEPVIEDGVAIRKRAAVRMMFELE